MNLADIYSYVDSKKRSLADAIRNPSLMAAKMAGAIQDDQRKMSQEFDQSGYLPRAGEAPHPNQAQAREALLNRGQDMALAGMFVGPTSQTWNVEKAMKASKMLANQATPEATWWGTQTFQGPDQAFRQEISDNQAVLRPSLSGLAKPLGEVLDHPELLAAYPDLMSKTKAQLIPGHDSFFDPNNQLIGVGKDSSKLSSMLHEIQHVIQEKENWARGGSTEQFKRLVTKPGMSPQEIENAAYKAYKKVAGEEEARLTQNRQFFDAEDRKDMYPGFRYDTPMLEQIIQGVDLSKIPRSYANQIVEQMLRVKP